METIGAGAADKVLDVLACKQRRRALGLRGRDERLGAGEPGALVGGREADDDGGDVAGKQRGLERGLERFDLGEFGRDQQKSGFGRVGHGRDQ